MGNGAITCEQGGSVINIEHIFKINQRLEIVLPRNPKKEKYSSRIEEVTPEHIVIAMPMSKGCPVLPFSGDIVYGKAVANGFSYKFKSTFIDKKLHPIPVWVITLPCDIEKIQQREFVRFDTSLTGKIKVLIEDCEDDSPSIPVVIKNISGGGVQIATKLSFQYGTKLKIDIDIPDFGSVLATGEIVRIERPQENSPVSWLGVKFSEIGEKNRDKIIKYIFKKQMELRKKNL